MLYESVTLVTMKHRGTFSVRQATTPSREVFNWCSPPPGRLLQWDRVGTRLSDGFGDTAKKLFTVALQRLNMTF